MEYLNKVLTSNVISLQMHKASLTSIILQTEQLNISRLSKEKIKNIYHKFLSANNIHHHTTMPELQRLAENHKHHPASTLTEKEDDKRGNTPPHTLQPQKSARHRSLLCDQIWQKGALHAKHEILALFKASPFQDSKSLGILSFFVSSSGLVLHKSNVRRLGTVRDLWDRASKWGTKQQFSTSTQRRTTPTPEVGGARNYLPV